MFRATLFLLSLFLLIPSAYAGQAPGRALFVSVIEKELVLSSKDNINKVIDFAGSAGIKILFVQVYRANMSWFPSKMADASPYEKCLKNVGEDPLALLIRKAHARGIEVHAWLNLLTLSKNTNAPLLKKYGPSILTRDRRPKRKLRDYEIDHQYFLEPGDLRVRRELGTMVEELLQAYPDLDGVQFDYIRYPDLHPVYGHGLMNVDRFREATGASAIRDKDPAWQDWKRAQVTDLLKGLIDKAKAIRPGIHISTTGCMSYARAYHEAFQDWPSWVESGLVEFVTVMSYPDTYEEFLKHLEDAGKRVTDLKKLKFGVPAYKLVEAPGIFIRQFDACEKAGSGGCAVFYYGSVLLSPALSDYLAPPVPPDSE